MEASRQALSQLLTGEGREANNAFLRDASHRLAPWVHMLRRLLATLSADVPCMEWDSHREERLFRSERSEATLCGTRKERIGEVNKGAQKAADTSRIGCATLEKPWPAQVGHATALFIRSSDTVHSCHRFPAVGASFKRCLCSLSCRRFWLQSRFSKLIWPVGRLWLLISNGVGKGSLRADHDRSREANRGHSASQAHWNGSSIEQRISLAPTDRIAT